tara:strand:+ start:416 stop:841 length:426 start_codon:yes stop_codon:yes gene_type:complete
MIQIFLALSLVINLILMAFVVGLLPLLLSLATIIIVTLVWYILKIRTELSNVSDDLDKFFKKIDDYEKHVDQIHGMEMFYGDQTLQGLIRHSREMINEIIDLQERYFLEEEEDFDRTQKEEEDSQEEKESILYRSPPESDS